MWPLKYSLHSSIRESCGHNYINDPNTAISMPFIALKESHLVLLKRGKITVHNSKSKGKRYSRGKLYLKDVKEAGLYYHLYEIEKVHLVSTNKQHKVGKAYLVFFPMN